MTYQLPTTSLRPQSRPTTSNSSSRPPSRSSQQPSSTGSGGLASPPKVEKQEEKPSMVDRFWSLFDSSGGTVSEDDTTSSSERALSFYDTVEMTIPEVPQVSASELAPEVIDPYIGAVGSGNREVAPNTMDSYLQGDVDIEAIMPPAAPSGLMSPPTQEDTDAAVAEAMGAEPVPEKVMPEPFVYDENEQQAFEARKETITDLGASFDTASRDDIRVLQKTLRDMEGPTKVDVGGIDGRWGTKGRNALWAFQLRAGISPTGEMDEETAKALNSPADYLDPRGSTVDASALDTPASKMLVGVEALKLMPYELNSSRQGRSGLTFGAGIDVGQHTAARLKRDFNFTDDMIEEFGVYNAETNPSGWIGRNPAHPSKGGQGGNKGTTARNRVHAEMATEYRRQREAGELPKVSEKWIAENVRPVYDLYVTKPKESYNNLYGSGAWAELPEEAQAIAVLENYRGDGVNNAQMRLLNEGNYIAAARAARKSSRAPAMIEILNSYGHQ